MAIGSWFTDPRRFNRLCSIVVLLWLVGCVSGALIHTPSSQDFSQFRMGGIIARFGAWDSLYPIPNPGSTRNPGAPEDSTQRPRYQELAERYAEPNWVRFMLPPPNAMLLYPFAFGSFSASHRIWLLLGALAGWGVAVQAGTIYTMLAGAQTRRSGWIILLVGMSILMYRSIRVGNVSTEMGWLLGAGVLELIRRDGPRAAGAIVFAGVIKYVGVILAPLVLFMGRRRTLVWSCVIGLAIVLVSLPIMGTDPYKVYFTEIYPTLKRSLPDPGNLSLEGFLLRITHRAVLTPGVAMVLTALRIIALLVVLGLLGYRARKGWTTAAIIAGAVSLIGWMLIFSPMFWEHYHIYLAPFWGWLLWEATRSKARFVAAWVAIVLAYVPLAIVMAASMDTPILRRIPPLRSIIHVIPWREPLISHMLWAAMLMWGLSLLTLMKDPAGGAALIAGE
jgi:Glycosyltransferase family 87